MSAPEGRDLARRQAELAAFLTGTGPLPAGVDERAGRSAARARDAKRPREMADSFPAMAAALDPDYRRLCP